MIIINHGAATAAASINKYTNMANSAVKNLATGDNGDNALQHTAAATATAYTQGAKNVKYLAGQYEMHTGIANGITALAQEKLEIASKYGQTGYELAEYQAAGARFRGLQTAMNALVATAATGTAKAFNAAKTESVVHGGAAYAVSTLARVIGTSAPAASTLTSVASYTAVATTTTVATAAQFAGVVATLTTELEDIAATATSLSNAVKMFDAMSAASGALAAGYSAYSTSAQTDFASETAKLAAAQIQAQAATAMVAQASVLDRATLALLQ
jgi:flagellin-like hook-associated protein FlgL